MIDKSYYEVCEFNYCMNLLQNGGCIRETDKKLKCRYYWSPICTYRDDDSKYFKMTDSGIVDTRRI